MNTPNPDKECLSLAHDATYLLLITSDHVDKELWDVIGKYLRSEMLKKIHETVSAVKKDD